MGCQLASWGLRWRSSRSLGSGTMQTTVACLLCHLLLPPCLSGGPVMNSNGKCVGIAFQALTGDTQSVG